MNVPEIQDRLRKFAAEQDWERYHSAKNLSAALAVEAAELMETFQWIGSKESRNVVNHPDKLEEVGSELADVCIYALRLAYVVGIDINSAITNKIEQNAQKYPPGTGRSWSM